MAVYVGPLKPCKPSRSWPWSDAATMYADVGELEALHAMAARIDVGRAWFREVGGLAHYLLSPRGVREAEKKGVVRVDGHAVAAAIRARSPGGSPGAGVGRRDEEKRVGPAGSLFGQEERGRML